MKLGAFSVSLSVKDLAKSAKFYEALGFQPAGGEVAQNWLMLRNGNTTIGLFQGMFEGNMMTFCPGWDQNAQEVEEFVDIRDIERRVTSEGIEPMTKTKAPTGPANFVMKDPDGNVILIDQHVG